MRQAEAVNQALRGMMASVKAARRPDTRPGNSPFVDRRTDAQRRADDRQAMIRSNRLRIPAPADALAVQNFNRANFTNPRGRGNVEGIPLGNEWFLQAQRRRLQYLDDMGRRGGLDPYEDYERGYLHDMTDPLPADLYTNPQYENGGFMRGKPYYPYRGVHPGLDQRGRWIGTQRESFPSFHGGANPDEQAREPEYTLPWWSDQVERRPPWILGRDPNLPKVQQYRWEWEESPPTQVVRSRLPVGGTPRPRTDPWEPRGRADGMGGPAPPTEKLDPAAELRRRLRKLGIETWDHLRGDANP
jgi:hypothetical protein